LTVHITGSHAELIKDPNGAYSQLIRLQEVNAKRNGAYADDSNRIQGASYTANSVSGHSSRKSSFERSMSRHSPQDPGRGNSHSLSSIEHEAKSSDNMKSGKNVFGRLLHLHKPETPILLLGCTAAVGNGAILPVFGLLISSAIKTFYEPPHKLRKDSVFWAEMYAILGVLSVLILPVQYSMFYMAGGKLIERIRALSFTRVVYQEIGWFDDPLNSRSVFLCLLSHFWNY
jgi:ATP-binding cassette subfamily B (MDR/TAP) protein 1